MAIKYVNQSEIPDAIFQAINDPSYSEGLEAFFNKLPPDVIELCEGRHYSVTQLPKSPRQVELFRRHSSKITLDGLAGYWRMLGHVVHFILEHYAPKGSLVEQRIWKVIDTEFGPCLLHGQADLILPSEGVLQDYKFTSPYAVVFGEKEDYHAQLNVLRYILEDDGHGRFDMNNDEIHIDEEPFSIEELENIFMFKALDRHRMKPDDPTDPYPCKEVLASPVPIWSTEKVEEYIFGRINEHLSAHESEDEDLPHCTAKERWERPTLYKVIKIDPKTGKLQKTSKHNTEVKMEAQDWAREHATDAKGKPIEYEIKEFPGEPVLCAGFCEICDFCNQRQEEIKNG